MVLPVKPNWEQTGWTDQSASCVVSLPGALFSGAAAAAAVASCSWEDAPCAGQHQVGWDRELQLFTLLLSQLSCWVQKYDYLLGNTIQPSQTGMPQRLQFLWCEGYQVCIHKICFSIPEFHSFHKELACKNASWIEGHAICLWSKGTLWWSRFPRCCSCYMKGVGRDSTYFKRDLGLLVSLCF